MKGGGMASATQFGDFDVPEGDLRPPDVFGRYSGGLCHEEKVADSVPGLSVD
jgi:hypothetical protein